MAVDAIFSMHERELITFEALPFPSRYFWFISKKKRGKNRSPSKTTTISSCLAEGIDYFLLFFVRWAAVKLDCSVSSSLSLKKKQHTQKGKKIRALLVCDHGETRK